MKNIKIILGFLLFVTFISCSKEDEVKDEQKPTITLNYAGGFPKPCAKLKRGQKFTLKVKATDNVGLASYAIDIHNNFDHHTHDDQGSKCDMEPSKNPTANTFKFDKNFQIQNKPKEYEISQAIAIPANADTGDYHCQISVVDVTGWQGRTSVDIKIVE